VIGSPASSVAVTASVIRIQKTRGWSHNAMPVSVGIVTEGDVKAVLQFDQPGHREGTGTIHPDFAIVIYSHECESRVDLRVHDGDIDRNAG
jgi:hypothetical protein